MIRELASVEFRPFDPTADVKAVVELLCDVSEYDGDDWFPTVTSLQLEWAPRPGFDPVRDVALIEVGGRLAAAGSVDWRERAGMIIHGNELWVRPEFRRRGLGRRVLGWLEGRARASVKDGSGGPTDSPHFLGGWLVMTNPAAVAFATAAGYAPIRYGFQMRRPLGVEIPDIAMPDGIEVRPVLPEHLRAIWDADVEAFQDHFEPRVRDEHDFARLMADPDTDTDMWQVAWDSGEVAGSVLNAIYPYENERTGVQAGSLDHVSVRRPWRGRGLAKALIVRSLVAHRDRGMTVAVLGVDAENPTGALQLYERLGFSPHKRWGTYRKPL